MKAATKARRPDESGVLDAGSCEDLVARLADGAPLTAEDRAAFTRALRRLQEAQSKQERQLKRARGELGKARRELASVEQAQASFLSKMGHELRTPLGSILILADLLAERHGGEEGEGGREHGRVAGYLRQIGEAGSDVKDVVNEVVELGRVAAGQVNLHRKPLHISRLVRQLRETFEPRARQAGLGFAVSLEPGLPDSLNTDRKQAVAILETLLGNAIQGTPEGKIALEVSRDGEAGVAFAVSDTGGAIPAEAREEIFTPFGHADARTRRKHGGRGLSLAIARELAVHLGGRLELAAPPAGGAAFTLWLPV